MNHLSAFYVSPQGSDSNSGIVGLYLDDASNHFLVYNNLIHGLQKHGKGKLSNSIYSKGIGNRFYNNIIADNNAAGSAFGTYEMFGEPNRDLVIERNIFSNCGDLYHFENWSDRRIKSSDYNLYYRLGESMRVCKKQEPSDPAQWLGLDEWRMLPGHAYDQHSRVEDPLFMDAEKADYRLTSDSPAYSLGFTDFNLQDIGLEADFPYPDQNEEIDRVFVRKIHDDANCGSITLMSGERTVLEVVARTATGFVSAKTATGTVEATDAVSIDFSSSDASVASMEGNGQLKAGREGTAIITVEVKRRTGTQSTRLYVNVK